MRNIAWYTENTEIYRRSQKILNICANLFSLCHLCTIYERRPSLANSQPSMLSKERFSSMRTTMWSILSRGVGMGVSYENGTQIPQINGDRKTCPDLGHANCLVLWFIQVIADQDVISFVIAEQGLQRLVNDFMIDFFVIVHQTIT